MAKKQSSPILNIILVLIGLALIITSIAYRTGNDTLVDEAGNEIVQADANYINAENEGRLIAVSSKIYASSELKDDFFGIAKQTYKLKRVVETYQWKYVCEEDDNCSYNKVWSEELIDSSEYAGDHKNPTSVQYASEEFKESGIALGSYLLTDTLVHNIDYDTDMGPDEIADLYKGNYTLIGEYITNSADINSPKIGDFRISYKYAKDKVMTVIAKQAGNSFAPYYSSDKKEIYSIEEGEISAADYIKSFDSTSQLFRVIIALFGIAFACFGFTSLVLGNIKQKPVK